jgi:hypothetical protein
MDEAATPALLGMGRPKRRTLLFEWLGDLVLCLLVSVPLSVPAMVTTISRPERGAYAVFWASMLAVACGVGAVAFLRLRRLRRTGARHRPSCGGCSPWRRRRRIHSAESATARVVSVLDLLEIGYGGTEHRENAGFVASEVDKPLNACSHYRLIANMGVLHRWSVHSSRLASSHHVRQAR